jgi:hypothetical protein
MGLRKRIAMALIAAALMAMIGCGSSSTDSGGSTDSGSSTSDSKSTTESAQTTKSNAEPTDSGAEPSKEFVGKGKNGQLAKIGKESSVAEREAASRALEENLDARAGGDWETQCETLASATVEQVEKGGAVLGAKSSCPEALEAQAGPVPPPARANTMTGPIDAFRVNQGINGFAFWHGTHGRDFVIPLIKQRGEWKVVALQEEEIR